MRKSVLGRHLDRFLPPDPEVDPNHLYEVTKHARDAVPAYFRDPVPLKSNNDTEKKRKVSFPDLQYLLHIILQPCDINI
jgi:hypothetical protein